MKKSSYIILIFLFSFLLANSRVSFLRPGAFMRASNYEAYNLKTFWNDLRSILWISRITNAYTTINNCTQSIKDIIDGKSEVSKFIKDSLKPAIIIGESILKLDSAEFILNGLKNFLIKTEKNTNKWNGFNLLAKSASRVGSYDLKAISNNGR